MDGGVFFNGHWALGNDDDADDVKGDWLISDLKLAATAVTGGRVKFLSVV